MDKVAWQTTYHGVAKSWIRLSDFTKTNTNKNFSRLKESDKKTIDSRLFRKTQES